MIATAIFLFLLGTKVDQSSAVQADVKYEPSRITIKEQIDQNPVPELGSPPYLPNFVHQGSNYFFGAPFGMQSGFLPFPPRREIIKEEIIISKEPVKVNPPKTNPIIKAETLEIFNNPIFTLPRPNITLNFQPSPIVPAISVPVVNSQLISRLPLPPLNIPTFPIINSEPPYLSTLMERPIYPSRDVFISEVDVLVKEIPPPPQLPPLNLKEMFKPIIVEKQIILVPSPPEIEVVYPPSMIMARQPCMPSKCARNIVFERVLPNLACENSKTVELISIPASKGNPVVTSSFLPYIIKRH